MASDDVGRSVRRLEDWRFLTGRGRYVEDVTTPDQAHAYVLRSPHAHAVIERIDTVKARETGGVLGIFTEADLRADGIGPLPCVAQVNTVDPLIVPPRYALAPCSHVSCFRKYGRTSPYDQPDKPYEAQRS